MGKELTLTLLPPKIEQKKKIMLQIKQSSNQMTLFQEDNKARMASAARLFLKLNDSCLALGEERTEPIFRVPGRSCEIWVVAPSSVARQLSFHHLAYKTNQKINEI